MAGVKAGCVHLCRVAGNTVIAYYKWHSVAVRWNTSINGYTLPLRCPDKIVWYFLPRRPWTIIYSTQCGHGRGLACDIIWWWLEKKIFWWNFGRKTLASKISPKNFLFQSSPYYVSVHIVCYIQGGPKISKPDNFCNNFSYCQPISIIFGTIVNLQPEDVCIVSPPNVVCVTTLPC